MLDYLPELLKGTAYQPDADRGVDYRGADPVADLHHYPDPEDAGAGMDSSRLYHLVYRRTPLLVQIFLIYYGPGQFPSLQEYPWLWHLISEPWLCALDRSVAQQRRLHHSAILWRHPGDPPTGEWQSCSALGMSKRILWRSCCRTPLSVRYRPIPTKWCWFSRVPLWPTPSR